MFYLSGSLSSSQSVGAATSDQERMENKTERKVVIRPKTSGAGDLRGVKMKGRLQRIGPTQQQKFRNTLERWLIKPMETSSTGDVCQTQNDEEMMDDDGFQSTSAQSLESKEAEILFVTDTDEETQPLTPADLDQDPPVSPAAKDSAGSDLTPTLLQSDDDLETTKMDTCPATSDGSVKLNSKITDFFSGVSSPGFPGKRRRSEKSPEKQDTENKPIPSEVSWLGTPINELKRMPECGKPLPPLKNVPGHHTVMIRV